MLHIRSKDCRQLTDGFNSHLEVVLKDSIDRKIGHKLQISISSAEIPYVFYNVSAHLQSNTLQASNLQGVSDSTVIPDGNYNIYDLVQHISTQAGGASNFPCLATFDEHSSKVTLTNVANVPIILNFSDPSVRELAKMLGFDRQETALGASPASITAQGVVNLRPIHSIFLHSNLTSSNVITTEFGSVENIIDKIPLGEVGPSQIITYDPYESAPFSTEVLTDNIHIFELSLRDQNGELIQLNNVRYEISLLITHQFVFDQDIENPRHPFPEAGRRSMHPSFTNVSESASKSEPYPSLSDNVVPALTKPLEHSIVPHTQPVNQSVKRPRTVETKVMSAADSAHLRKQEIDLQNAILLASSLPSMNI